MNIATELQAFEAKNLAPLDARDALIDEVWRGLAERPRSLVPWMLYDAEGSRLFERITTLPEYYPTRTERHILADSADAIIAATGSDYSRPLRLLELGAGTAAKTGLLLSAATCLRNEVIYLPVDVSSDALDAACAIASLACCRTCSYNRWWRTTSLTRRNWNGSTGQRSQYISVRASVTSRRRRLAPFFAIWDLNSRPAMRCC